MADTFQNRTTGAKLGNMLTSRFNHSSSLQPIMSFYMLFAANISSLSFTRVSGWTLNGIWSFLRPRLHASRFPLKRVKNSPPLQVKCFRVGLPCYLGLNSGRSVSINVNKTRKHFSRNIHGARIFPQCFPVCHMEKNVSHSGSIVSHCFQDANYAYATREAILTKTRVCE